MGKGRLKIAGLEIFNSEVYTEELCTGQNLYVQDRKDE